MHTASSQQCFPGLVEQDDAEFEPFEGGITSEAVDAAYDLLAPSAKVGARDQVRVILRSNTFFVHQRNDTDLTRGRPQYARPRTAQAHRRPDSSWPLSAAFARMCGSPLVLQLLKLLCSSPGGLPDADAVFNAGDYGLVSADKPTASGSTTPPPVWSFAKQPAVHRDLWYPYWSTLWLEDEKLKSAVVATPWDQKAPRLVWRGSQTGNPPTSATSWQRNPWQTHRWRYTTRGQLVRRCANLSDAICDAGFHRWAPWVSEGVRREIEGESGALRPRLEWAEMQRNRYVALVDGEGGTSASRSVREFGEGTATFKTESPASEFWYALLRPFVHYVPLSASLEDLEGRLEWARSNDALVRRISQEAAGLKRRQLTDEHILCYMRTRWRRYAGLLRFSPSVRRASACAPTGGACRVPFRRLKVLPTLAQKLRKYVVRHNLSSSHEWCLAVLRNHSRHPEQVL